MKRSKKLFYRTRQYRRYRQSTQDRVDSMLSTRTKKNRSPRNPANVALSPRLYSDRAHVLRITRRRVGLSIRRYEHIASQFGRAKLHCARRVLTRQATAWRKNRIGSKYTKKTLHVLKFITPFLRTRVHRAFSKAVSSCRARVSLTTSRATLLVKGGAKTLFVRKFIYTRKNFQFAAWRRGSTRRLSILRRCQRKHARRRVAHEPELRRACTNNPRLKRRTGRFTKNVKIWRAKGLYRWLRRQRTRRLQAVRFYKRKMPVRRLWKTKKVGRTSWAIKPERKNFWIIKRKPKATKLLPVRLQMGVDWKSSHKVSQERQLRRKIRRRERPANRSSVVRRRKKRIKLFYKHQIRRFSTRYKTRRVLPVQTFKTQRVYVRKFFQRQVVRQRFWLSTISARARRTSRVCLKVVLPRSGKIRAYRQLTPPLLRSAVRVRAVVYRALRKRALLRIRRKSKHIKLVRRHGLRWFVLVGWRSSRFQLRREIRQDKRTVRKGRKLQRRSGRSWARWKRLPRRFLRVRGRAARRVFTPYPRLFGRGAWSYFYGDRYARRVSAKTAEHAKVLTSVPTYAAPQRLPVLRTRHKQQPRWYTSSIERRALYTASLRKHVKLARLVQHRLRARRTLFAGNVYSLQGASSPKYFSRAMFHKNLRCMRGRKRGRARMHYGNREINLVPRLARAKSFFCKRVSAGTAVVGMRMGGRLLSRGARLLKDKGYTLRPAAAISRFTLDLQRELSNVKTFARKKNFIKKRRPVFVSKSDSEGRALRKFAHSKMWFARAYAGLYLLRTTLYWRQITRRSKNSRYWYRVARSVRLEDALTQAVDDAFVQHPAPLAKFHEEVWLKRAETKSITAIQEKNVHAKTRKTSETPSQTWAKAVKTIKEILRSQAKEPASAASAQKPSPTSHKSWPTSPLSVPRHKVDDIKEEN